MELLSGNLHTVEIGKKKMEDRSRLTLRYNRQNRYIDPKLWCSKKNPPPKNTIWLLAGRDSLFI